ncbi:MAG: DUF2703 domain-containing protein [Acidobacteriota bacterium]|nr:DUF2703 domain-containing protein [Acidobacteriota bacterium]
MRVQLLYIPGCPNHRPAAERLGRLLAEQGVVRAIEEVEVSNASVARELAFAGSPTIRIDGDDVEPLGAGTVIAALSCRTYEDHGSLSGLPSEASISSAIRRARGRDRA